MLDGDRLHRPVKDVVVLESLADKEVSEQFTEVRVIGLVIESERSAVVEVDSELVGECAAENLGRSGHLWRGISYNLQGVGKESLFSIIRSYFCFLVAAFNPCQGS
jgi:hypothetical protein